MTNFYERKKTKWTILIALSLIAVIACGAASTKNKTAPLKPSTYNPQISLAPLVEKVASSVVNIATTEKQHPGFGRNMPDIFRWFFGPHLSPGQPRPLPDNMPKRRSLGSGFIIESNGLVVTNHHVIKRADEIEVRLSDDRTFKAKVVGSDERTDVALLKLKNAKNLPTVSFGNSDKLKVGDRVIAIGNPFGLNHTVTSGIVSAKERNIGAGPYDDFIQTDTAINPGNSGGPLFNLAGEVIGINTAIAPSGEGIGFAIPSSLASPVIDALHYDGKVTRGWLGISYQPLNSELAKSFGMKEKTGALVGNVEHGSPAEKAGMKHGDIIIKVGDKKLSSHKKLSVLVASAKPGKTLPVKIVRNGKELTLKVKIGKLTETSRDKKKNPRTEKDISLGFQVESLDARTRNQLGAEGIGGVVVTRVKPDSKAAQILKRGDVIVEVGREKTPDVGKFNEIIAKYNKGDDILLRIFRKGGWLYTVTRL